MRFEFCWGGHADEAFLPVQTAFLSNFRAGRERDAQCCVYVRGKCVVDLWASAKDSPNRGTYDGDSLQVICSSTKSLTSLAVAWLVDRGRLRYSDAVAESWPEFAKNGKDSVTVADVLRHEGGIPNPDGFFRPEALLRENIKRNEIGDVLEAEDLKFPPESFGSKREYHPFSRGFILNELFRRNDEQGRTIGEWLHQEVALKLDADVHIGASDAADAVLNRLAAVGVWDTKEALRLSLLPWWMDGRMPLSPRETWRKGKEVNATASLGPECSRLNPIPWFAPHRPMTLADSVGMTRDERYLRGEVPSANGLCSARGMAKVASVLSRRGIINEADENGSSEPSRLISDETWHLMHSEGKEAKDFLLDSIAEGISPTEFTQGGVNFFRSRPKSDHSSAHPLRTMRAGFFGWMGYGGSVLQWHPALQLGFAYAPTLWAWYDPANTIGAELQAVAKECAIAAAAAADEDDKNETDSGSKASAQTTISTG